MTGQDVPMSKKLLYSVNQLGTNMLWYAFSTVAVFFYVSRLHAPAVSLSTAMIVFGFINAFLNLLAGHVSDRTKSRFGRRIPYIAAAGLPFGLAFFFLFTPPNLHGTSLVGYFLALTLIFDAAFTFVALNIGSLFPEMYQEARPRAYVAALMQVFGIIGLIVGVALSKSLGMTVGWSIMGGAFGLLAIVTVYLSLAGSFENPIYSEQTAFSLKPAMAATFQNPKFVRYVVASFLIQFCTTLFTTVSSFYTQYVVSVSATESTIFLGGIFIIALPFTFVWARVAIRIGTARATIVSAIWYALAIMGFLVDHNAFMLILNGLVLGIAVSGFLVLLNILLADVIDYDAQGTGRRREGMYLGMNGFIVRLGLSLNYVVMALYFAFSGFNSHHAVQSLKAQWGIRILAGALPVLFIVIALIFLVQYHRIPSPVRNVTKDSPIVDAN